MLNNKNQNQLKRYLQKIKKALNQNKTTDEQTNRKIWFTKQINMHLIFQQFETLRYFGDSIFNGKITIGEDDKKTKQSIKHCFRI